VAFCLVIAAHTTFNQTFPPIILIADGFVYLSAIYCIVRGIPVLVESRRLLAG